MKKVLITGILGQDGSILADYLLKKKGYEVYGMQRRTSNPNLSNISSFLNDENFEIVYGDLSDKVSILKLVKEIRPDYFINFAANSFVGLSWDMPFQVFDVNTLGVIRCLEAIKNFQPNCKFYNAGSSEEIGEIEYSPQDLKHPLNPQSPYGASKASARQIVRVYRKSYNLFAIHGMLFNHEGPKRGIEFVTKKISTNVARIYDSLKKNEEFKPLELGNIHVKRDWGDAEEYVKGIWLMLQQEKPKEYTLATGKQHSVKEFVEEAFQCVGINGEWKENKENPLKTTYEYQGKTLMKINPKYYRVSEIHKLLGDPSKIEKDLGWSSKTTFKELVKKMVDHDLNLLKN